ncbi:dc3, putative [Perkinsus marinus ATCC 50983]|uniref:Dc3, putative n=1 Tax=Perkinsus marinus (strain ATCC 50983 / TXsc) TaxID=423536 RepID=C5KSZ3_PERM5|nr:dc3, putative [Perkinsus marinus ATCC 50983]EER12343.1 dc3, putative [Perkinsus marinus ATCC 50983]|eukprot:XP_002780548.1 dc3, putative [Perkinsus marinus ATCC 50983]
MPAVSPMPKPTPLEELGSSPMTMQSAPQIAVTPHRANLTINPRQFQAFDAKGPWASMLQARGGNPTPTSSGAFPAGSCQPPRGQFEPFKCGTPLGRPVVRRATEVVPAFRPGYQFGGRPPMASSLQNTPRVHRDYNPVFFSPQPPPPRQVTMSHQPAGLSIPPSPQVETRTNRWPFYSAGTEGKGNMLFPSAGATAVSREATAPGRQFFTAPLAPNTQFPGFGPPPKELEGRVVRRIRIGIDGTVKSIEDLTDRDDTRPADVAEAPAVTRTVTASVTSTPQDNGVSASAQVESVVVTSVDVGSKPPLAPRFQPQTKQLRTSLTTTTVNRAASAHRTRVQARIWGPVAGSKVDLPTVAAGQNKVTTVELEALKRVFAWIDTKKDDILDYEEIISAFHRVGYKIARIDVEQFIWEVDDDLDGTVSWDEFLVMYQRCVFDKTGLEPRGLFILVEFLMYTAELLEFDKTFKGAIAVENTLEVLFVRHGRERLDDEIKQIFGTTSSDGVEIGQESTINFTEFHDKMNERIRMLRSSQGKMAQQGTSETVAPSGGRPTRAAAKSGRKNLTK